MDSAHGNKMGYDVLSADLVPLLGTLSALQFHIICIIHCFLLLKCKSQEERALSVYFIIGISP